MEYSIELNWIYYVVFISSWWSLLKKLKYGVLEGIQWKTHNKYKIGNEEPNFDKYKRERK